MPKRRGRLLCFFFFLSHREAEWEPDVRQRIAVAAGGDQRDRSSPAGFLHMYLRTNSAHKTCQTRRPHREQMSDLRPSKQAQLVSREEELERNLEGNL